MKEILKFIPYYKQVLWGGNRIASFKGLPPQGDHIGECWELSSVPGHVSVIENGTLKGLSINDALSAHGTDIMGDRLFDRYGDRFPLMVKLIDSTDDLSVQVHPDDNLAAKKHDSLGKTEMWYSINPIPGAYLYAGFHQKVDKETIRERIKDHSIISSLSKFYTARGDVFYLPAGRVHSIGPGNLVLEIHEASDVTYRIYDYDRRDSNGNPRDLHIDDAIEAIDFEDVADIKKTNILPVEGEMQTLVDCPYFTAEITGIDGSRIFDLSDRDSFTILTAIDGDMTAKADENSVSLRCGETALVPASVARMVIEGSGSIIMTHIR